MESAISNKSLYDDALKELDGKRDEALWIKSIVECDGDEGEARISYVKWRVKELSGLEDSGNDVVADECNEEEKNVGFTQILEKGGLNFFGDYAVEIRARARAIVNAKKHKSLVYDVFVSPELMVCGPSIFGSSVNWWGALSVLTGPAGMLAAGLVGESARILGSINAKEKPLNNMQILNLEKFIVFDLSGCTLRAKEVKTSWDLTGGIWETHVHISCRWMIDGIVKPVGVGFYFDGRTTKGSKAKPKNNMLPLICKMINRSIPEIPEDRDPFWEMPKKFEY